LKYCWYFAVILVLGGNEALIAQERFVASGSSTVAPLVSELVVSFESKEDVRIDIETGGSSRGVADVRRGLTDFGMISRELNADETDLLAFTIAWDGIAIIVNKNNALSELNREEIKSIFSGEVVNWRELGAEDRGIVVVNKAQGRSTLDLFLDFFTMQAADIKAQTIIGDNQQGLKLIAQNPGAIGYVSIGAAEYLAANGGRIKLLPIDGVASSRENVRNNSYPLRRPLNLVLKSEPTGKLAEFIRFASSSAVNDIIEDYYFVPIVD